MNELLKELGLFTTSLHTHVRSLYDAQIDAKALCEKINELGGKGCVITDHGCLSSIEDYRRVFADYGLKLVPGCELYVDGGVLGRLHLVVIARDDCGYKGICKMVTAANYNLVKGVPVLEKSTLFQMMGEYKNHIFALSACMQGVLSAIFLQNNTVEKKINSVKIKQMHYTAPDAPEVTDTQASVAHAEAVVQECIKKRDDVKALSELKFAKREKAIDKLTKDGKDVSEYVAELIRDKEAAEKAKMQLPQVKTDLDKARKALSAANKALKEKLESVDKYLAYDEEIKLLEAELKSDTDIYETAKTTACEYRDAFGKNCFLAEVQYHGIAEEAVCFPKVVRLANELKIPIVATNDVHILTNSEDDRLRRQILRSMRYGEKFEEENTGDDQLYLKDNLELYEALVQIITPEDAIRAIKNIAVVFDNCDVTFETGKHYPRFVE